MLDGDTPAPAPRSAALFRISRDVWSALAIAVTYVVATIVVIALLAAAPRSGPESTVLLDLSQDASAPGRTGAPQSQVEDRPSVGGAPSVTLSGWATWYDDGGLPRGPLHGRHAGRFLRVVGRPLRSLHSRAQRGEGTVIEAREEIDR